jgi:hypothetical protein
VNETAEALVLLQHLCGNLRKVRIDLGQTIRQSDRFSKTFILNLIRSVLCSEDKAKVAGSTRFESRIDHVLF